MNSILCQADNHQGVYSAGMLGAKTEIPVHYVMPFTFQRVNRSVPGPVSGMSHLRHG